MLGSFVCDGARPDEGVGKASIPEAPGPPGLKVSPPQAGAATSVSQFDGGGKTDWFLPSKDELNELYKQRDTVGGFGIGNEGSSFDAYWSSTQSDAGTTGFADVAWTQYFDGGEQQGNDCKCNTFGVRPVRAF